MTFIRLLLILCVFVCIGAGRAWADLDSYIQPWLMQPKLQFGDLTVETSDVREYYARTGYRPAWTDLYGMNDRARRALDVVARSDLNRRDPARYRIDIIQSVAAIPRTDVQAIIRVNTALDILISETLMHYAVDTQGGKDALQPAVLLQQVTLAADPALFLAQFTPSARPVAGLQDALARYQALARAGGWPAFVPGKIIRQDMADTRLAALAKILASNGDLPVMPSVVTVYDMALIDAVKRFQTRHGIAASGIVDRATQIALAVPVEQRIAQIEATMDRMHAMPPDMGSRFVLVNIPAYSLTAVANGQRTTMRVIVGKTATPTPTFSKNITDVVFNPTWTVPAKIAAREILPKIRKDPAYLTRAGYKVIGRHGAIDPASVDWQNASNDHFDYSLRQDAGDGNALGKVKFNIPDSDNIYLHDTSQHRLFARDERNLSHGCVRVENPKALVDFVMGGEGWGGPKIDAAYESDASRTVHIAPLPVYLVYWTSWIDADGQVHFSRDIYGMDKKLIAARTPEPIRLAAGN